MEIESLINQAMKPEELQFIKEYQNKIVVVKYGGSAMTDENIKKNVVEDLALLKKAGLKPIVVHGGGKEINKWLSRLGIENKFVNGLRVTDEPTLEIAEMALSKLNKELVQLMESFGVKSVGISGKDAGTIKVSKRYSDETDLGYVGKINNVDNSLIMMLLEKDITPIICPIGLDENYQGYNINADEAACAVATCVKAEKLVFLTDIEGVCKDPKDSSTVIPKLSVHEAKQFLNSGGAGGGMLPKLMNCIEAVENGVSRVHIIDGRVQHSLLKEFLNKKMGTMILEKGNI
ncbi:MAG: acetylglutamate kinase [Sedimentibacter saalensis]|jgi:acetylglutamate kinase|uniref:acetylglutamate kinase n=1 Tax=Sedimentibacter saalensis TaxID=130788 RepID=UPI002B1F9356|nr:acetylglutamate kinase [Sedimentibacter saalensis]MEA5094794.1 acetylglutamate kinase [Sedimentibacter saalensis]